MIWRVGVRRGDADTYSPPQARGEGRLLVSVNGGSSPHRVREHVIAAIEEKLGCGPSSVATDLLKIALAVYSTDLSVPRDLAQDDWTRDLSVYMPVDNAGMWEQARPQLEQTLRFLSGDRWDFSFRGIPAPRAAENRDGDESPQFDTVCLFSGGLDSLVGAVELLRSGKRVILVGHYGGGSTSKFQRQVYEVLESEFKDHVACLRFQVLPPQIGRTDADPPSEETQRSRSFLFFALGLAVADAIGPQVPLHIPENGLISLNVPMTGARYGSASTRTTHPFYVKCFREMLSKIGLQHELVLPYRFKTKAEMLRESTAPDLLKKLVPMTISCAHPDQRRRQGLTPGAHCGHCFPCILRRATVALADYPDAAYDLDVLTDAPDPSTKTGQNLRAVHMAVERLSRMPPHRGMFEALKSGPIEPQEIGGFTGVYLRGMKELADFYGG